MEISDTPNPKLLKIAIVGRPNVGKSSLFNRIVGKRQAIVEEISGTTRDRLYADVSYKGKNFTIIDTGGFKVDREDIILELVVKQLDKAIKEADILFFVVDGVSGITPQDRDLSEKLRVTSKKIYLIVNKIDNLSLEDEIFDFYELGIGEPYAISAMHNIGVEKLLNDLSRNIDAVGDATYLNSTKVAIVGRPNVGKSSFLNSLLEEERAIVHSIAGTTRDSIDTKFNFGGKNYILIDTAGVRHKKKLKESTDFYSNIRTDEAIRRSDIAMVLIDGNDGLREDDSRIINQALEEGKALIVVVNKWDLVKGFEMSKYKDMLIGAMKSIRNLPIIFASCKTGRNVRSTVKVIDTVYENYKKLMPVHEFAKILNLLNNSTEIKRKGIKFGYGLQVRSAPPKFVFLVNSVGLISDATENYIENFLRKTLDLEGIPISLEFKEKNKFSEHPGKSQRKKRKK